MTIPSQNVNYTQPMYMYPNQVQQPVAPQQAPSVDNASQNNNTHQIYQYPTTSIYNPSGEKTTVPSSGVTIQIFNPAGIGGPVSTSVANANYPTPQIPAQTTVQTPVVQAASSPIANTPIQAEAKEEKKNVKTKNVVELTDSYIKTLENYLKNPDKQVRRSGITDLIQRFHEDSTRYDDPALVALLNIALQDPVPANRVYAMSTICAEDATGDENTINLLKKLQTSDKMYGEEAKMATEALLKASQRKIQVPKE